VENVHRWCVMKSLVSGLFVGVGCRLANGLQMGVTGVVAAAGFLSLGLWPF